MPKSRRQAKEVFVVPIVAANESGNHARPVSNLQKKILEIELKDYTLQERKKHEQLQIALASYNANYMEGKKFSSNKALKHRKLQEISELVNWFEDKEDFSVEISVSVDNGMKINIVKIKPSLSERFANDVAKFEAELGSLRFETLTFEDVFKEEETATELSSQAPALTMSYPHTNAKRSNGGSSPANAHHNDDCCSDPHPDMGESVKTRRSCR
jgi:hypothetical protein